MDFYPVLDNPLQDEVKCNPHKAGMKSRGAGMEARPYAFVILSQYFAVYPLGISVYQPFPLETA